MPTYGIIYTTTLDIWEKKGGVSGEIKAIRLVGRFSARYTDSETAFVLGFRLMISVGIELN